MVWRVSRIESQLSLLDIGMAEKVPSVSVALQKDIRIVEFTNNKILDESNIAEIGQTLAVLIEETPKPKLLLDFANVDHLSSAALGMLINVSNKIKDRNGQLRLAGIKPQIFEVFVITKLNKLFRILPTRPEALASFAQ
jgi:anti-sigma B factor antagonist